MSTRRKITAATVLAPSLAIALALASTATAAAPTSQPRETFPYEFTVPCSPSGFAFDDLVQGAETRSVQTFTDAHGIPSRQVTHDAFQETDTNSATGKTLPFSGNLVETIDLTVGTRTVVGRAFLMTDPGRGIVIHDTGRAVFDAPFHVVFEAGPKDVLHGDLDQLTCQALAEP